MTKTLQLPDPLYDALERAAEASGTTPAGWIAARLPRPHDEGAATEARTLADLLAGRVGRVRSGGKQTLSE
jgi:hypothetical protein